MCLCGLRFKKHIFHILYIIVAPLCSAFLKCINFYKAHRSEKRGVLWLPVIQCVVFGRIPQPYCDAVSWQDDTKTIKPTINETFVASSWDIITDYNDLYCHFMHRVALRRLNFTMSAFVIGETTNNKHYTTQLKTCVWIVSGKFFK